MIAAPARDDELTRCPVSWCTWTLYPHPSGEVGPRETSEVLASHVATHDPIDRGAS